jgi:formylmethanofuran dehydrogenase subunit E
MNIPDNYDQWNRHERDQEKRLAERPRCDICDQPIQDDHFYLINGDNVCPVCLNDEFRKEIED